MNVPAQNRYQSSSKFRAQATGTKKISSKGIPPTTDSPALNRSSREAGCISFEIVEVIVMANVKNHTTAKAKLLTVGWNVGLGVGIS